MKKRKTIVIVLAILLIFITVIGCVIYKIDSKTQLKSIKSKSQLSKIYKGESTNSFNGLLYVLGMPASLFSSAYTSSSGIAQGTISSAPSSIKDGLTIDATTNSADAESTKSFSSNDYSTTNIQVENVDEADIIKNDGKYLYSLSDNDVIITNSEDPENISVASKITVSQGTPVDLMLYNNKLVIISDYYISANSYRYNNTNNTIVDVYDIQDKTTPERVKTYTLYEPYYTSRCINNKLYVISSGKLRKDYNNKDDIATYYYEDNNKIDIKLKDIKYLKDIKTNNQTLISTLDLDNPTENINLQSYLIDISNAYVSQNNIYLLNQSYKYSNDYTPLSAIFGFKGILGLSDYSSSSSDSDTSTTIYKFNILDNGSIKYSAKAKETGKTINQFSLDEYNGNLRVALYNTNGSKVVVFNDNLEKIGQTSYLAKGENMYSSRFFGNKAYLVTYRTVDPLYVIDLSEPTTPKVLGELKIPGYSTYLHPYDENHIIGIGMETKETVNRNSFGRVTFTSSRIVGMKMALFDVTDPNNPTQISSTVIGDSRTSSAILTNHKALLFSKEKELLAIPVNNYVEDFEITNSSDSYSSIVNSYTSYGKQYLSEGYLVYNINLKDGITLKGKVVHEGTSSRYSSYNNTKLLRGAYIGNNLYTISEDMIKVNSLDNLKQLSELKLREKETKNNNKQKSSIVPLYED